MMLVGISARPVAQATTGILTHLCCCELQRLHSTAHTHNVNVRKYIIRKQVR